MKSKTLIRFAFLGALLAWLAFLAAGFILSFTISKNLPTSIPIWTPQIFFALYVLFAYYNLNLRFHAGDSLTFTDVLWHVFVTGLVSTGLSLLLRVAFFFMDDASSHFSLVNSFVMQLNFGLFANFLLTALVAWRRLILHQKSKWLIHLWTFFIVLLSLLLADITLSPLLPEEVGIGISIAAVITIIVLATQVRWIAYLNFRQKWTGLLLLLLTLAYLTYFSAAPLFNNFPYFKKQILTTSLHPSNPFITVLCIFVAIYSIFSFLVMLFNLPTSWVLEQKMEEASSFLRLSQSIQTEQSEESVYTILLESSINTVSANAAFLEIKNKNQAQMYALLITEADILAIAALMKNTEATEPIYLNRLKGSRYRSLLQVPVLVRGEPLGRLTVLKELPNGFNKEMIRTVKNFTRQAGISIENFRLLEEAFQTERYKEELKIAKEVQKSLLPQKPEANPHFEMQTFSQAADEVGGDYYDTLRFDDHQIAWIIADVSGKGTSAAFHMSQMKGIFHTLGQLKFNPKEFMITANMALKCCLDKNSFISAAYFIINTEKRQIIYARAGHCPILYYNSQTQTTGYFKDKGTALGMVRNEKYKDTVHMYEIGYHSGDVMVLYTDGITETSNGRDEFGYDGLAAALREVTSQSAKEIQEHILDKVYAFSGTTNLNDDYTMVIIKFMDHPVNDTLV